MSEDNPRPDVTAALVEQQAAAAIEREEARSTRVRVLARHDNGVEHGQISHMHIGAPPEGVPHRRVRLRPTTDEDVCEMLDVAEDTAPPAATASRVGPARVATPAYRDGWDRVFGKGRAN